MYNTLGITFFFWLKGSNIDQFPSLPSPDLFIFKYRVNLLPSLDSLPQQSRQTLPSPRSQSFQPHHINHLNLIFLLRLLPACRPTPLHHPSTYNLLPRHLYFFLFQYNLVRQARRRDSSRSLNATRGQVSAAGGLFLPHLVVGIVDFLTFLHVVVRKGGGDPFALA